MTLTQKTDRVYHMVSTPIPRDYLQEWTTIQDLQLTIPYGVFIPRPETEKWVIRASEEYQNTIRQTPVVVDLCSGAGLISMMLAKKFPHISIVSLDINSLAIEAQKKSLLKNQITTVAPRMSDLLEGAQTNELQDWILFSNPPYVPEGDRQYMKEHNIEHEPQDAIFGGGKSGLDLFQKILEQMQRHTLPKLAFFELDPRNILLATKYAKAALNPTTTHHWSDENGWHRVLVLEW